MVRVLCPRRLHPGGGGGGVLRWRRRLQGRGAYGLIEGWHTQATALCSQAAVTFK
nr:hypothetical protein asmbl_10 [uncultured bacterium]